MCGASLGIDVCYRTLFAVRGRDPSRFARRGSALPASQAARDAAILLLEYGCCLLGGVYHYVAGFKGGAQPLVKPPTFFAAA